MIADVPGLQFNDHETGDGELIRRHAGRLGFEGVVSKTIDAPYAPGNRGLWRKSKCLNRQEFVVVGWTDPEGSRPHLGALLLGYYTDDGKLIYAGRVGTGMPDKVLADLRRRLDPLARASLPLSAPPPRKTRFGSPLVLSRVHWVEPQLVAEITYLTWTGDGLLRHTVYVGLRSDKPARQVRRRPLIRLTWFALSGQCDPKLGCGGCSGSVLADDPHGALLDRVGVRCRLPLRRRRPRARRPRTTFPCSPSGCVQSFQRKHACPLQKR